jgi:hypothetical protein
MLGLTCSTIERDEETFGGSSMLHEITFGRSNQAFPAATERPAGDELN